MSDKIASIKNKVAGLKDQQIRRQYDNTTSVGDEAFEMNTPRELNMELSGRNRGRAVAPGYKYSTDQLQAAMDASNTENMIGYSIFDNVLRRTGNPTLATTAMNAASYVPFLGTAMGAEDAYDAARYIPDAYSMNGVPGVLGQLGTVALGAGDAALSIAPIAKPLFQGAKKATRPVFKELEQYFRREGKMQ
jgi:hypothetical protein